MLNSFFQFISDLQEVLIEFRPFPEIVMFFLGRMIHEGSKICIHLHLDLFEVTLDNVSVVLVPDPVDKIHWALEFGKLAFSRSAERVGFRFERELTQTEIRERERVLQRVVARDTMAMNW